MFVFGFVWLFDLHEESMSLGRASDAGEKVVRVCGIVSLLT